MVLSGGSVGARGTVDHSTLRALGNAGDDNDEESNWEVDDFSVGATVNKSNDQRVEQNKKATAFRKNFERTFLGSLTKTPRAQEVLRKVH